MKFIDIKFVSDKNVKILSEINFIWMDFIRLRELPAGILSG